MKLKQNMILLIGAVALLALGAWLGWIQGRSSGGVGSVGSAHADAAKDSHGHEEKGGEHEEGKEEAHGDEGIIKKTSEELKSIGADVAKASPGRIASVVVLQGALEPLPESIAHVVPRIPGVVREVRKTLGDAVRKGEILAILESRDLADAKSTWRAAKAKREAAETALKREEDLWAKRITPEKDLIEARKASTEAQIDYDSSTQKLGNLGFSEARLDALLENSGSLVRFELTSPLAGTIVERHLTVGESTKDAEPAFVVAELSKVNAVVQVYPKDLASIAKDQSAQVKLSTGSEVASGKVTFVSPLLDATSRAARAHILLDNTAGLFRPGLFVAATLQTSESEANIVIPKEALQKIEGKDVVFVQTEEGFVPSPVELGRQNGTQVEILSGLEEGEVFVSKGSFLLKAELAKSEAGHDHAH
jgi:cobalt-zinc-cadmium efflux system membrane fusion protein